MIGERVVLVTPSHKCEEAGQECMQVGSSELWLRDSKIEKVPPLIKFAKYPLQSLMPSDISAMRKETIQVGSAIY